MLWFLAVLCGFLGVSLVFERCLRRASRTARGLWVAALTAIYGWVLFTSATTGPYGTAEFVAPASQNGASGLFQNEANRIGAGRLYERPQEYLAAFPRILRSYRRQYEQTVRINNNPPGITMVFYAAGLAAREFPWLARLACVPIFGAGYEPVHLEQAQSVFGIWILHLGASAALVPAYLVVSRLARRPSFLACALAMLAGSLVLFVPGKDTFQVTFFLWMYWFFLKGVERRPIAWGLAMGFAAAGVFFLTLGAALVVVVMVGHDVVGFFLGERRNMRSRLLFWSASAAGLAIGFVLLYAAVRYNSLASLVECYRNHAAFYRYFPRTYWKWLLYNPWELALFTGGPLAAAAVWYGGRVVWLRRTNGGSPRAAAHIGVVLLVMVILNLAGKNMGEVNRLWVFFMPLVTLPACVILCGESRLRVAGGEGGVPERRDAPPEWRNAGPSLVAAIASMQVASLVFLRMFVDIWRVEALFEDVMKYAGN